MNAMKKLNVGVIGVGWFGELHTRVYSSLPQVNLLGVYDENTARAGEVSKKHGVRAFDNLDELLKDPSLEAVSICTSDNNHLEPVLKACAAGKHILVEKPMARTVDDCDRMIAAVKKSGVKLMPGHVLRFNNSFVHARRKIEQGEIGDICHLYSHRSLTRSAAHRISAWGEYHSILYHLAVHDIDLMCWLTNDRIVEVYADCHAGVIEAEGTNQSDAVLTMLRFSRGAIAIMEHSWIHPNNYPILVEAETQITGTGGKITLDMSGRGGISFTDQQVHQFYETYWPVIEGQNSCDLRNELNEYVNCLISEASLPVSVDDGRNAVCVVSAIIESLNKHAPASVSY